MDAAVHAATICSCVPAHHQPIRVTVFGRFSFFHTGQRADVPGLGAGGAVISFPLFELLGSFLWRAVAAGSLSFDELSYRR